MGKNTVVIDKNELEELKKAAHDLAEENVQLRQKLDRMNELLLNAQRARFGQSSERTKYVMQGGTQLGLFNEAEQDHKAVEPTENTIVIPEHTRKAKRTVDELTANLPVKEVLITLSDDELICGKCGGKYEMIGKKLVSRRLEVIPRQCYVVEYYSCSYACKSCETKTGYANIVTTVTPPMLMKHSLASASTVANVMTQKYVDGLPLARQEKIWEREGICLSRATMSNWVIQCAQTWLKPLYRRMKKTLLECSVIHADETVVQVLKEDGKAATSESRMWVYANNDRSGKPIRYFEYQPDRSGKHAAAFLKGFSGCLVTDGYAGYNQVDGVIRCRCWSHMRRYWREAMPKGATKETSKAAWGYDYCNKLFALEKKFSKMSDVIRKTARQVEAEPLLEAYWWWLETLDPAPGSKLADAVTYATMNQFPSKNYFTLPNEIFSLGLSAGEIAVYAYLRCLENPSSYQCWPSYATIGKAIGRTKNTVMQYVDALSEKGLISTEPTSVLTRSRIKKNGNLRYTIKPIHEAVEIFHARQLSAVECATERRQIQRKLSAVNLLPGA